MPSRDNESEFVMECVLGHRDAHRMIMDLFSVSQVLDDLIDKDRPVDEEEIFKTYHTCLVDIPRNPFYLNHLNFLVPLFSQYLMDWYDATLLERKGTNHFKDVAFGLRTNLASIVTQCAYLIGGLDHKQSVAIEVRKHFWMETMTEYRDDLQQKGF